MKNVQEFHNKIEKWHIFALQSFTAYQALRVATATNKVGKETAQENFNVIKKYADAFMAFQNALRIASFSNLAKIFIGYQRKNKTALSLNYLLHELSSLPSVDKKHLDQLKLKLGRSKQVEELKKIRDQQIAHLDQNLDDVEFSDKHFKDLLNLSNEILMFSAWCINGSMQNNKYYETVSNQIDMDINALLNTLKVAQAYPDEFNDITNRYWRAR